MIGQGTWGMEHNPKESIRALRAGIQAGATLIDTAEMYGDGRVEEIVGEAIAGLRDQVFLVSKVLPENATYQGTLAACERSLRRLGTHRLDGYLLHWPGSHPLEETLAAFEELRRTGRIHTWGLSNFDEKELAAALRIAGPDRIACNQVLYHLEERAIEHAVLPFCQERGIAIMAYSPFGSGHFPTPESPGGQVLEEIARARDATPRQIALAFLLRHSGVVAIPKASQVQHVLENAAAGDLELTDEEIRRIDQAFPRGPRRPGVPVL